MRCHDELDQTCVLCLQRRLAEVSSAAERAAHTYERTRADYEQLEMINAELREDIVRLERAVDFYTTDRR